MEWSLDFCLVCDTQTDGHVYCSEACRLAEYEKSSSSPSGSLASSPVAPRGPVSWPAARSHNGFHMEPAYNFSKAQPYGTTPTRSEFAPIARSPPASFTTRPVLTPSSSQSSLFSMRSSSSTSSASSEPVQLSAESKRALRAYASSFDQSRRSRRQSAN